MQIAIFRFSKKEFRKIHSDHLGFIIASSHCCNELVCFLPYIIFEHDLVDANEVEKRFVIMRHLAIVRLLASKILEYHELFNRYQSKIRKTFPSRAADLGKSYKPISQKISGVRWAKTLRNKVTFHFDQDYALSNLDDGAADDLNFMAGDKQAVTAFGFAEEVMTVPIFKDAGDGDLKKGADVVYKFVLDLVMPICEFHSKLMIRIFEQYGLIGKPEWMTLRDKFSARPGDIQIPVVVIHEPSKSRLDG